MSTILFIDDDPDILSGLIRQLRDIPYQVLTASSADEAVRSIESAEVDLVICDQEMPGMSGTEFLSWLAKHHPDIVRILLTGHASLETALQAINEGRIYHFFEKPCDPIQLKVTIRHALEQKHMRETSQNLLDEVERIFRTGLEMIHAIRLFFNAGNEAVATCERQNEYEQSTTGVA
jgi:two-component system, probable response regulator PhcQ